jgi:DNA polymerase elongation subunit (family B)
MLEKPDYVDVKGLQCKRSDSCLLLQETQKRCLDLLLYSGKIPGERSSRSGGGDGGSQSQGQSQSSQSQGSDDVHWEAKDTVRRVVTQLLRGGVSTHKLLLSRKLAKREYAVKTPHSELAKRLTARDAAAAPKIGDRVQFVMVEARGSATTGEAPLAAETAAEKARAKTKSKGRGRVMKAEPAYAEEPLFALTHGLRPDARWYIGHQLRKPLTELFSLVMPRPQVNSARKKEQRRSHCETILLYSAHITRICETFVCVFITHTFDQCAPRTPRRSCLQMLSEWS